MNDEIDEKTQLGVPTEEIPEEVGSVKVADEVLSIVAGLAASEVPGVAGMSGGIRGGINDMLGKQNFSKGIKVIPNGKTVSLEVYVYIQYGYSIPDVAISLQEKVKEAVENMTGYEVATVDIHVEGIRRVERKNFDEENVKSSEETKEATAEANKKTTDEEQSFSLTEEEQLGKEEEDKLKKFLEEDE